MIKKRISRIEVKFNNLKNDDRKAFVSFVMAGDPDYKTSLEIIKGLPDAGVDILEIGMPFTDPMADGPIIQRAGLRALSGGQNMIKTFDLVAEFRKKNDTTPIILMGYYNPIYSYGVDSFLAKCKEVGVDGLIVVDLPPEEDSELCIPALNADVDFIRLTTPTTNKSRVEKVMQNTSGFVYYVSVAGITGAYSAAVSNVKNSVEFLKSHTDLPVVVGFGVNTGEQAKKIADVSDGVVVGSSIIKTLEDTLKDDKVTSETVEEIISYVKMLTDSVHI